MRKLGQTIAAVLVNMALLRIGYTDNVLNAANITGDILGRMYADSVLITSVRYLLVFALLRFVYPLWKEQIAALQLQKEERLRRLHEEQLNNH